MILILGSIEDEHAFSTMGFVKKKICNKLREHLPLCTHMFMQKFYILKTFLYHEVVKYGGHRSIDIP